MTEAGFTKGPYRWGSSGKPGGNGDFNIYIIDSTDRKIAAVWGKRGEKEKTADLLAAAPDMFAALSELDYCIGNGAADDRWGAACEAARAALKKAEGGEQ